MSALGKVEIASLKDWILEWEASVPKAKEVSHNPAIKLLDFFMSIPDSSEKGGIELEVKCTILASQSMGRLKQLD
ncbi:LOW QUALITY PROTEIN: hypothetical protein HJFPF1_10306 [Paramyrothecium foliicola]|nr:LOW QUALITY PROTEIN: hypothetical protein HJFPF1_10306 [Paramyrothecium foliicola]